MEYKEDDYLRLSVLQHWPIEFSRLQTRENHAFCKAHDIRLSGSPLGRRRTDSTDEKVQGQPNRDACVRNAVEGRNGNAKRRRGLDLTIWPELQKLKQHSAS